MITRESAVLVFDLAADKQVCALTDQDSRVLARRTVKAKAWQLAEAVSWGLAQATAAGFSSVVVACEPTGHRWRVLDQIAAGLGVRLVCVQPLLVHRARESEDFTHNKSDETDAMIIARLVTELRCYLPERADPVWARLRHLGARRAALVTDATAARQQVADLLECAWPATLEAAGKPMKSKSWLAAMTVVLDRVGASGDLSVVRRWGWARFAAAVRREVASHGATRWYAKIVRAVFDAATDPARSRLVWPTSAPRAGTDPFALPTCPRPRRDRPRRDPHVAVLDELALPACDQHPRLSAVGAAAILAETATRTVHQRPALVKHAGCAPATTPQHLPGKTASATRPPPAPPRGVRAVWAALRTTPCSPPVRAPTAARQQAHPHPGPVASPQPAASAPRRPTTARPTPPSPALPRPAKEPPLPHNPSAVATTQPAFASITSRKRPCSPALLHQTHKLQQPASPTTNRSPLHPTPPPHQTTPQPHHLPSQSHHPLLLPSLLAGSGTHGRRTHQRWDRATALAHREDRREPHPVHHDQARTLRLGRRQATRARGRDLPQSSPQALTRPFGKSAVWRMRQREPDPDAPQTILEASNARTCWDSLLRPGAVSSPRVHPAEV